MLSDSKTRKGRSAVLGFHANAQTALQKICPSLRQKGKCSLYNSECSLRRELAKAMEEKIKRKARELYDMQLEVDELEKKLEDGEACGTGAVFSLDPSKKKYVLEKLEEELRLEPEYKNWSLEAAVAEEMAMRGLKRCFYAHNGGDVMNALKKREAKQKRQSDANGASTLEGKGGKAAGRLVVEESSAPLEKKTACSETAWDKRRHHLFSQLTPVQQVIVYLLWQQRCAVPLQVVCEDVREELCLKEKSRLYAEAAAAHGLPTGTKSEEAEDEAIEEALDRVLESSEFQEKVEALSQTCVAHRVSAPQPLGRYDLSHLPRLLRFISDHPKGIPEGTRSFASHAEGKPNHVQAVPSVPPLLAVTLHYFKGDQIGRNHPSSLLPRRLSEKEVDLSVPRQAESLLQCFEFLLLVFEEERRLSGGKVQTDGDADEVLFSRLRLGISAPEALFQLALSTHTAAQKGGVAKGDHFEEDPFKLPSWLTEGRGPYLDTPFQLHELTLRHCNLTNADALISALQKRPTLSSHLMSLDLSHNRLQSLRFLYLLRQQQERRLEGEAGKSVAEREKEEESGRRPALACGGVPLVQLSLKANAITQKPDYQEQVRCCLPKLMILDGKKIRRKPLLLLNPTSCSPTVLSLDASSDDVPDNVSVKSVADPASAYASSSMTVQEAQSVMDFVERFFYMWETRYIPLTAMEQRESELQMRQGGRGIEESEMDDETYPYRYHHPHSVFSFSLSPHLTMMHPKLVRLDREVEMEKADEVARKRRRHDEYVEKKRRKREMKKGKPRKDNPESDDETQDDEIKEAVDEPVADPAAEVDEAPEAPHPAHVLPLNPQDYREAQMLAVSLRNGSRNLLLGRRALTQIARGCSSCFIAYNSTIYPERVQVDHHLGGASLSWLKIPAPRGGRPQYMVQIHGVMTWVLPSMTSQLPHLFAESGDALSTAVSQVFCAAYDRTLFLSPTVFSKKNKTWEKRKRHALSLQTDILHLRPHHNLPETLAASALFLPHGSTRRVLYYTLAWGLQNGDGVRLVRAVVERARSDAALYAALDWIVFGLVRDPTASNGERVSLLPLEVVMMREEKEEMNKGESGSEERRESWRRRDLLAYAALEKRLQQTSMNSSPLFVVSTSLSTPDSLSGRKGTASRFIRTSTISGADEEAEKEPHTISTTLLHDITAIMNQHYTV